MSQPGQPAIPSAGNIDREVRTLKEVWQTKKPRAGGHNKQ